MFHRKIWFILPKNIVSCTSLGWKMFDQNAVGIIIPTAFFYITLLHCYRYYQYHVNTFIAKGNVCVTTIVYVSTLYYQFPFGYYDLCVLPVSTKLKSLVSFSPESGMEVKSLYFHDFSLTWLNLTKKKKNVCATLRYPKFILVYLTNYDDFL